MLIAVSSISGSPGVSSWSLLFSAAWPGDDRRNRVLVETDSTGGVLAVRYGLSSTPGIVELISNVRQGIGLRETLTASAHRLDEQLWAVPAPSSADAAWPILVRMGELGPVLSDGNGIWFVDCGRWWPSSPCVGVTSAADLNLIMVDADDSSLLSVRSRVHHFRQFGAVGVVVVGSTQRSLEELEMNFEADKVWNIPHMKQLDILAGQAATTGQSKRSKSRRSKAWRQALKMSTDLRQLLDSSIIGQSEGDTQLPYFPESQSNQFPSGSQHAGFHSPPSQIQHLPIEPVQQTQTVTDFGPPPVAPVESVPFAAVTPPVPVESVPFAAVTPPVPVESVPFAAVTPPVPPNPPMEKTEIASTPMPSVPADRSDAGSTTTEEDPVVSISSEQYDPSFTTPKVDVSPLPVDAPVLGLPGDQFLNRSVGEPAVDNIREMGEFEQPPFPDTPAPHPFPEATLRSPAKPDAPEVPVESVISDSPEMPATQTAVPEQPAMPPPDAMTTLSSAQLSGAEFYVAQPVEEIQSADGLASNEQLPVELKPHGNKSLLEIAATTANVPGVTRVTNTATFTENQENVGDVAGMSDGVPRMPPVHNVANPQVYANQDQRATVMPDDVTPIHPVESPVLAEISDEPPNASYFYDAPTLLPAKKSVVSTPEEAAPTGKGSIDESHGDSRP